MKKYIVFPLLLLGAFFAAGCGTKNTADDNSLVVLNYGKYMDSSVLKLFEQETGIHVKLEEYESPEEMYTKYKAGSIGYDLICTSDYMVERLISEGEVNKIDFSSFSNYQNIDPSIIDAGKDLCPGCLLLHALILTGTLGILYNITMVTADEVFHLEYPVG